MNLPPKKLVYTGSTETHRRLAVLDSHRRFTRTPEEFPPSPCNPGLRIEV
jgi:hypothetical protein